MHKTSIPNPSGPNSLHAVPPSNAFPQTNAFPHFNATVPSNSLTPPNSAYQPIAYPPTPLTPTTEPQNLMLQKLGSNIEHQTNFYKSLSTDIHKLEIRIRDLEKENGTLGTQVRDKDDYLHQWAAWQKANDPDELNDRIDELEGQMSEQGGQIRELEGEKDQLRDQKIQNERNHQSEIEKLKADHGKQLQEKETANDELQSKIKMLEAGRDQLRDEKMQEKTAHQEQIKIHKMEHEKALQDKDSVNTEIKSQTKTLEDKIAELDSKVQEAHQEAKKANAENETLQQARDQLQENLNECDASKKAEIKAIQFTNSQAYDDLKKKTDDEISRLRQGIEDLEAEQKKGLKKQRETTSSLNRANEDLKTVRQDLTTARTDLQFSTTTLNKANDDLNAAKSRNKKANEDHARMNRALQNTSASKTATEAKHIRAVTKWLCVEIELQNARAQAGDAREALESEWRERNEEYGEMAGYYSAKKKHGREREVGERGGDVKRQRTIPSRDD